MVLHALVLGLVLWPMLRLLEQVGFMEWYQEVVANPTTPPEPPLMTNTQSTLLR
ncbi:MAG: hypothetical protein R2795_12650 [Saprospiraceae bacterium]